MTNFEEITKDTETLAKYLTLVNSECRCCIAQNECNKLKQSGETYRICVRSWCTWLNKEVTQ